MAALAEYPTQGTRHGEDELPVGHVVTEGVGDPMPGLANPALMAGRAEVASLAGEGEELLMPAVGAQEAGEALGKVATAVEFLDDLNGVGAKRPVSLAVGGFVLGKEALPGVVEALTDTPVVCLLGARQCGKSTLAGYLAPDRNLP